MALTASQVERAKPRDKPFKLYDEKGLFLIIRPNGAKWWRFKYRLDGKQKEISMGVFPDVSLKRARKKRQDARELLADGVDPSAVKKAKKEARNEAQSNSFEVIAREWFNKQKHTWAPSHSDKIIRRLQRDIFPWLGKQPVSAITAPELLKTLRRIESRGAIETAHRAMQNCGQIFRYAVATGRAERDPSSDLKGALPPVKKSHLAAITDPKEIGGLLRSIDSYSGQMVVKSALKLAPLVFVRPGELRKAEWSEINLETAEWNIPAERMKIRQPHLVPLSTQAVKILEDLKPLTGEGRFVFPSMRSNQNPMSDNAILSALRRMGYAKDEMSGHGFRAMARTVLDEILEVRPDFIEHQLAHAVRDPNGRAYNRTAHLQERHRMMQLWADYLDGLKGEAQSNR